MFAKTAQRVSAAVISRLLLHAATESADVAFAEISQPLSACLSSQLLLETTSKHADPGFVSHVIPVLKNE